MASYRQQRAIEDELRKMLIKTGEDSEGATFEYQALTITAGDLEVATRVNVSHPPMASKSEKPVIAGSVQFIRHSVFGPSFRKKADEVEISRPSDDTRPYTNAAHDERYHQHARALAATRDDLFGEIRALRNEIDQLKSQSQASELRGMKKLLFAAVRLLHKLATGLGERVPDIIETAVNPPAKTEEKRS